VRTGTFTSTDSVTVLIHFSSRDLGYALPIGMRYPSVWPTHRGAVHARRAGIPPPGPGLPPAIRYSGPREKVMAVDALCER